MKKIVHRGRRARRIAVGRVRRERSIRSSSAARWCAASAPALPASPRRTRKAITRASTSTIAARWRPACSAMPRKVRYVALTAQNRFTALQSGEIDVLYRNSTQTYLRGVTLGLRQGPVNFYDGQGFVVKKDLGVKELKDLKGATVCVAQGTTHEVTLGDYGRANGIDWKPLVFDRIDTMYQTFFGGRCDAMTQDASALAGAVATAAPNAGRLRRAAADHQQGAARPVHPQRRRGVERHHHLAALRPDRGRRARRHRRPMPTRWRSRRCRRCSACSAPSGDLGSRLGLDNKWMLLAIKAGGNYWRDLRAQCRQGEPAEARPRPQRHLDQGRPDVRDSVQVASGSTLPVRPGCTASLASAKMWTPGRGQVGVLGTHAYFSVAPALRPARSARRRNAPASCRRSRRCRAALSASPAASRRCRRWWNRAAPHRPARRACARSRERHAFSAACSAGSPLPPPFGCAARSPRRDLLRIARLRVLAACSRSHTSVSPFSTPREVSVSFSAPKASLSARRWPIATSWRSTARHCFSLSSRPMPNTDSLSWPNCVTFSVSRPISTSIRCMAPKRCPVR